MGGGWWVSLTFVVGTESGKEKNGSFLTNRDSLWFPHLPRIPALCHGLFAVRGQTRNWLLRVSSFSAKNKVLGLGKDAIRLMFHEARPIPLGAHFAVLRTLPDCLRLCSATTPTGVCVESTRSSRGNRRGRTCIGGSSFKYLTHFLFNPAAAPPNRRRQALS